MKHKKPSKNHARKPKKKEKNIPMKTRQDLSDVIKEVDASAQALLDKIDASPDSLGEIDTTLAVDALNQANEALLDATLKLDAKQPA